MHRRTAYVDRVVFELQIHLRGPCFVSSLVLSDGALLLTATRDSFPFDFQSSNGIAVEAHQGRITLASHGGAVGRQSTNDEGGGARDRF